MKTAIKFVLDKGVGSQFGEDKVLKNLLPELGFYVDVGAYHPHLYSNTYALYKKGWRGIVVEPNRDMKLLFRLFRPRDTFINAGIGNGTLQYSSYQDGAYNGFSPDVPARVKLLAQYPVVYKPLSEIIRGISHINFLNIDVEGMDLEVLTSHDWLVPIDVIAVEGEESGPVAQFLEDKGYTLYAVKGKTLIFNFS